MKAIVESHRQYIACADEILGSPKMVYFIENLVRAYSLMRYGEAKFHVGGDEAAKTLDELFFMLDMTWADTIKGEQGPLYVPKAFQEVFLKDNNSFTSEKITDNMLAIIGFPVQGLPELPRK